VNDYRNLIDDSDEKIFEDTYDIDGKNLIKLTCLVLMRILQISLGLKFSNLYGQKVATAID
jgi:hypothetical protein